MRGKLLFVAGLAVGYVVGARAGRPAYDQVVERVRGAVSDPKVQEVAQKAKATLEEKAPAVASVTEKVAGTAAGAASAAAQAEAPAEESAEDSDGKTSGGKADAGSSDAGGSDDASSAATSNVVDSPSSTEESVPSGADDESAPKPSDLPIAGGASRGTGGSGTKRAGSAGAGTAPGA